MGDLRARQRTWLVDSRDYETDAEFRVAVEQELVDVYAIGYRSGRGVIVLPVRAEIAQGVWETIAFAFEETFVPAARSEPIVETEGIADEELAEEFPEPVET